ncbi:MAG: alpha-glycosidase [Oscillospiraceae bacterium]|nr:alpha-glycosidase [Oscillospiraceae bacterium]
MNKAAIWHEATGRYCFCLSPGRFLFRLQTGADPIKAVLLHTRDKYLPLTVRDTRRATPMVKVASDGLRDYYEAELEFHVVCLRYYFEIVDEHGVSWFYSNDCFRKHPPTDIERYFDCPQNLREEERFVTPEWARNKVIYQIFPSRFATTEHVPDAVWYQAPIGPMADLKGNLPGITQHLEHIRDLGAEVVYMTPIFYSHSSHKYDTIDYYRIDPSFGTEADLIALVDRAHGLGLRVILDGVFNHTAPDFFAFRDLKEKEASSDYVNWYYPESFPLKTFPGKPNYKTFSYFCGMPKVNLRCAEAAEYFTNVALYWLRRTGADGWRLDVADEISHGFWKQFRRAVKSEFPEALIVGEVWHHAPDFLQGDEWDSVMNYPFYRAVLDFAVEGVATASEFLGALGFQRGNTHTAAYPLLWNLLGSHDTPRLLHLCNGDRARHRLAAAIALLSPGMPMIYYGDEVGMTGAKDPDCRRGMVWDESRWDRATYDWYRALLRVRKALPAITEGTLLRQDAWDDLSLIRITREKDGRRATVIFHAADGTVHLPELAGKRDLLTGKVFDGTLSGFTAMVLE